jgi:hypothetical protein
MRRLIFLVYSIGICTVLSATTAIAADKPSPSADIWERQSNQAVRIEAASPPQVQVNQTDVPASGHNIGGEGIPCGDVRVSCATVIVTVPANSAITSLVREARELGGPWTTDPNNALGWCWWDSQTDQIVDGKRRFAVTLKNWSHNRTRQIRLTVYYQ